MNADLAGLVSRHVSGRADEQPLMTQIEGLILLRSSTSRMPSHILFKPALCLVVQGAKWTTFGERRMVYRAGEALVVTVEMPGLSQVVEASRDKPYLGVIIELDPGSMRQVIERLGVSPSFTGSAPHATFVANCAGPLIDCATRAVRLLDTPDAIPVLYPAIMQEICYWLVTGPNGNDVIRTTLGNSHPQRLIAAIHALRDRFAEAIRIDELAAIAGLSPSAFCRQFKAITSVTALQYQKQLRLLEARRLMISGDANAETAGFRVGYESPSQFSREYARMFGAPPRRDINTIRKSAA